MRSPAYEPAHCIVCGHAESTVVAEADDMRAEVEALWAFQQRRLSPDTPVDRLRDRVAFSQHPPLRLVACAECGLVYRNPIERAFELESAYARDVPPHGLLASLHETQRRSYRHQARRLRARVPHGASVLEVGSYVGAFLSAARDVGLSASGVDINPAVNAFTRTLGFRVIDGELHDVQPGRVDCIAIWNTFDQLGDPRGAALAARRLLPDGGVLAIRVPNGAFYRQWRQRLRGFPLAALAHNNLLTFPYRWGFNPGSLSSLLEDTGFRVTGLVGDVLVPTADEWTRTWARAEEWAVKRLLKGFRGPIASHAPWFEIYATASPARP